VIGAIVSAVDGAGSVGNNASLMTSKHSDENLTGKDLADKKLAVLGAGKLGGILLRAYLKQGLFARRT